MVYSNPLHVLVLPCGHPSLRELIPGLACVDFPRHAPPSKAVSASRLSQPSFGMGNPATGETGAGGLLPPVSSTSHNGTALSASGASSGSGTSGVGGRFPSKSPSHLDKRFGAAVAGRVGARSVTHSVSSGSLSEQESDAVSEPLIKQPSTAAFQSQQSQSGHLENQARSRLLEDLATWLSFCQVRDRVSFKTVYWSQLAETQFQRLPSRAGIVATVAAEVPCLHTLCYPSQHCECSSELQYYSPAGNPPLPPGTAAAVQLALPCPAPLEQQRVPAASARCPAQQQWRLRRSPVPGSSEWGARFDGA
jgi:hypothetical protein